MDTWLAFHIGMPCKRASYRQGGAWANVPNVQVVIYIRMTSDPGDNAIIATRRAGPVK